MKYISVFILMFVLSQTASAQMYNYAGDYHFNLTWDIAIPGEGMSDYIDETSWAGMGIEIKKFLSKNTSVGFFFGWNVFDTRESGTFELENGHVSGTQVRNINSFPFTLNFHFYFPGGSITPFIGLNAGAYYIFQKFQLGIMTIDNDNWHFGLAPEVGFEIPLSRSLAFLVSGKYNYAFASGEQINGDDGVDYQYYGINVGFTFMN